MAIARALLVALLFVVSVTFTYGTLNPEADLVCQGEMFPSCSDKLNYLNCSAEKSEGVKCAEEALSKLKQKDCNDQQRKGAKRLVDLYKFADWFACNNTKFWEGKNETQIQTCWMAMKEFVLDVMFGYGSMPCLYNEFTETRANEKIEQACSSKEHLKFFPAIMKEGDCTSGAYVTRTNAAVLTLMSLCTLILAAIL